MGIEIRKPEPKNPITLSRAGWLDVLAFTTEFAETASSDTLEAQARELITAARSFVLEKKPADHEFTYEIDRSQTLDLFLFFGEFKEQMAKNQIVCGVFENLKSYILGVKQ